MVGIEEADDLMEGLSSMVVAEHFRMDGGVTVAKVCGKLHFGMLCVVPTNKASDKPNDDHVAGGGDDHRRRYFPKRHLLAMYNDGCYKGHRGQDKNKSGEFPILIVSDASFSRSSSASARSGRHTIALTMYPGCKGFVFIGTDRLSHGAPTALNGYGKTLLTRTGSIVELKQVQQKARRVAVARRQAEKWGFPCAPVGLFHPT